MIRNLVKCTQKSKKRLEQSWSVIHRRHGKSGRQKAVRSSESSQQVKFVFKERLQKSERRVLGMI